MAKRGRKQITLDWEAFDKLCGFHCTLEEIASWFDCSPDTIERAVKRQHKMNFAEYLAQKRAFGRISLRRAQLKSVEKGNVTMQIWLGKQWLGQSDKQELTGKAGGPLQAEVTVGWFDLMKELIHDDTSDD